MMVEGTHYYDDCYCKGCKQARMGKSKPMKLPSERIEEKPALFIEMQDGLNKKVVFNYERMEEIAKILDEQHKEIQKLKEK